MEISDLPAPEIWSRILERARRELPDQTFKTWLEPTEALELSGDTLVVGAPDRFAADSHAVAGAQRAQAASHADPEYPHS